MIYKPGRLTIRQNLKENQDEEILGRNININALHIGTDIPNCMTAQEIEWTTTDTYNS